MPLIELSALPEKQGRRVRTAGLDLALFKIDGVVFAIDDSCPHAGASLASGRVEGQSVACRAHGLRFDLDPHCPRDPTRLEVKKYKVRVADGWVMLDGDAC